MRSQFANLTLHVPAMLLLTVVASTSFGQTPLTQGTVVTGQCYGHESQPGCVLPNLFGPEGLTLAVPAGGFSHYAHFLGSAQTTLNTTLSTAIATQLATLPIISPASGFTFTYDASAGVYVRNTTSFGPVYSERADTIGRGKISFGASYQRFRFSTIDGISLHSIPAVFTHVPGTGPNGAVEPYEADVIQTSNSLGVNMDQTLLFATVGLTNHLDFSVAVPITSVRLDALSGANIDRVSGQYFNIVVNGTSETFPNPHTFSNGTLTNYYAATPKGSATGIGDVTLRLKQSVYRGQVFQVAAALDVRAPTGNARDFLGAGAIGVKPFLIVSANRRFSPHLNLGYQWNGSSILAGNITGATFVEQSGQEYITNGDSIKARLPGQISYSAGADYGATKQLSLSFDYLGQTLINTPRVFLGTAQTANDTGVCNVVSGANYCGLASMSLPDITGGKDTIALSSGSVGLKYNLFHQLILTANVLFRMDNKGLRQNVTPLIALSYAFGLK
jgi:hypothetical protein